MVQSSLGCKTYRQRIKSSSHCIDVRLTEENQVIISSNIHRGTPLWLSPAFSLWEMRQYYSCNRISQLSSQSIQRGMYSCTQSLLGPTSFVFLLEFREVFGRNILLAVVFSLSPAPIFLQFFNVMKFYKEEEKEPVHDILFSCCY